MALIYNGKAIGPGVIIKFAGVALQKIVYKGVVVWQKYTSSSARISSYYAQLRTSTTPMIAASSSPGDPNNMLYNRGSMSGNTLSWIGTGAYIKANCDCKLTVSGTIRPHSVGEYGKKGWYYKNETQLAQIFWTNTTSQTVTLSYTINLKAGDTFSIRTAPESAGNGIVQFELSSTFSAAPV